MAQDSEEVETIDPMTGEILSEGTQLPYRDEVFTGLSATAVTEKQAAALLEPVSDDEIQVLPSTGAVYLSHPGYRRRLNAAFGPRGWGMRRLTPFQKVGKTLWAEIALYAEGQCVGTAVGEANNENLSFGDAAEAIKSNALMRICKDLGMAMELWDKKRADGWRDANCFKAKVKGRPNWRKTDSVAPWNEDGLYEDSPNRDKYAANLKATNQELWRKLGYDRQQQQPGQRQVRPQEEPPREQPKQAQPEPPREQQKQAAPPANAGKKDGRVTAAQVKVLWGTVSNYGLDQNVVADYLKKQYRVDASKELLAKDFDNILLWIKRQAEREPGQEG